MSKNETPSWIVVAECDTLPEASILAGAINNEGIPTSIMNSALQSALPMTYTWAPVQIMVPADMADAARKLVPIENRV